MASEKSMRSRVVKALSPLHAMAVENLCQPGTPDVAYIGGWIELKSENRWPAKPETPLRLKKFTPLQRLWLRKHWQLGGKSWLLLRVGREWLLFDGETAAAIVGLVPRAQLVFAAKGHWPDTPSDADLLQMFDALRRSI